MPHSSISARTSGASKEFGSGPAVRSPALNGRDDIGWISPDLITKGKGADEGGKI